MKMLRLVASLVFLLAGCQDTPTTPAGATTPALEIGLGRKSSPSWSPGRSTMSRAST